MGHLGAGGEGVHGQISEVFGVANGDVEDEVLAARDVEDGPNFVEGKAVEVKCLHVFSGMSGEAHRDQGLQVDAQGFGIDGGVGVEEDALVAQAVYALGAGGGGQPDLVGQLTIGDAAIILQNAQNVAIDSI